jgi:acetyl-CoA C-acetyltransferase
MGCFDFYSCFPCSVSIACKMLGIEKSDPRPLTLTGGLGFFGGPGNNYSLHAIATLAEAISRGLYNHGLITSLGWFMHKHAAGVYSATPGDTRLQYADLEDEKDFLAGGDPVPAVEEASGQGEIETYTMIYKRDGTPAYGVIYGKTDRGFRFVAQTPRDPDLFKALSTENQVGKKVRLQFDVGKRRNIAELG